MSPRRPASRYDATARIFLDAAGALIDAAMSDSDQVPARLRAIKFPAALEWIRVEDVLRLVEGASGGSRKAFRQRWATRDDFIRDAVVYVLQAEDRPANEYGPLTDRLHDLDLADLGTGIAGLATDLLRYAESTPRSYLMLHLGGLLHRHPGLQEAYAEAWEAMRVPFVDGYVAVLEHAGLVFRPEWDPLRFDRAVQALMDGFLLQSRLHPDAVRRDPWTHTELFADTVLAFTLGTLADGNSATSMREAINQRVRPPGSGAGQSRSL